MERLYARHPANPVIAFQKWGAAASVGPMRRWHAAAAVSILATAGLLVGLNRAAALTEEATPEPTGFTALGLAEDGTLLVRALSCGGPVAGPVTISRGTTDQPGSAVVASYPAADPVRVDPADLGADPTVLTIRVGDTEAAVASVIGWQAVNPGLWLVTEPEADGAESLSLTDDGFRDRFCRAAEGSTARSR